MGVEFSWCFGVPLEFKDFKEEEEGGRHQRTSEGVCVCAFACVCVFEVCMCARTVYA